MTDAHDPSFYESLLQDVGAGTPQARIRPSTSVIPWRVAGGASKEGGTGTGGIEVFWVRRAPTMQFMAGFWAFPGGGLSRSDAAVAVAGTPKGTSAETFTRASPELDADAMHAVGPDLVPGLAAGTLRELFEETGLLLLDGVPTGSPGRDALETQRVALETQRAALLRKELDFATLVGQQGRPVDAGELVFAGRWLTPPFASMRFDNRFFLLHWPADRSLQPCLADDSVEGVRCEHDRGEWVRPADALERWRRGEILAAPPILHILRVLSEEGLDAEGSVSKGALERLRDTSEADLGPMRKIEFRPGLVLMPLRTPTLPPASHTNAFLLGHPGGEAVLVDPATPLPDEQDQLLRALDAARDQGYDVRQLWLSHHHPDHVGAVDAVRSHLASRHGRRVRVLAHAADAAVLRRRGLDIDGELRDGQRVVLDGPAPLAVRVVHTPGHTRGHLCFFVESTRTLLAGDLTSTLSTIVIDPPDGDMDEYLASLRKAADLDPAILFPSHGPGHPQARRHLEDLLQHRLEREDKIVAAWNDGLRAVDDLVARVYDDVPAAVHPVALRQLEAHLQRLRRAGRVGGE